MRNRLLWQRDMKLRRTLIRVLFTEYHYLVVQADRMREMVAALDYKNKYVRTRARACAWRVG